MGMSPSNPEVHPLLGVRSSLDTAQTVFESTLSRTEHPWLYDHRVAGKALLPGTALAELVRAAGELHFDRKPVQVLSLVFQTPLELPESGSQRLRVVLSDDDDGLRASVYSQPANAKAETPWTLHASAEVRPATAVTATSRLDLEGVRSRCTKPVEVEQAYASFASKGLAYGPAFRGMRSLSEGKAEAVAHIVLPKGVEGAERYGIHPALLDASLHAAIGLGESDTLALPFAIDRLTVYEAGAAEAMVNARRSESAGAAASSDLPVVDVTLTDAQGHVLVEVAGLRLRPASLEALEGVENSVANALYRVEWPLAAASPTPAAGLEGRWAVVAEQEDELAQALAERLAAVGVSRTVTSVGRLGEALPAEHVVCVWPRGKSNEATPDEALRLATEGLAVVQRLAKEATRPLRLVWVTTGALAVTSREAVASVACGALWGLGRTVTQEHPELACRLVDLEPASDAVEQLLAELRLTDDESEVAWRAGQRRVARLVRAPTSTVPATDNYALEISRSGMLETLTLVPMQRRSPGATEVEIAVRASGINFRDVLAALGVEAGTEGSLSAPLGHECAGVVTAVGAGVEHLAVGDAVMAFGPGSFQRFVTVDERHVAPIPAGLSFEQAASIPVAFLTAWYALHDLAGLKSEEHLLVHAAAGGVGMAAVQLARRIGAEVYGTASPSKWQVVRALGVEHVASSRDLDFVDAFRRATEGSGVDVVLNALAGEFVDASASLMRSGGRFVEMGKTDIRDPAAMAARYPETTYRAFDLREAGLERIQQMLEAIRQGLATGQLRPLPVRTFDVTEAEEAFRILAQGRNVGKLVLAASRTLRTDGTVLITGGLGNLGLQVAHWLAARGVRHLLLTGRRGKDTPGTKEAVAALEELGARVTVAALDVADREAVATALAAIPTDLPLRGVVHAAGVLDDALLSEQTTERFAHVMGPKVAGGWHLHELTRTADLDVFISFSSIAGTFGSAGQGPYAAANAFLDALAAHRRGQGLPGQSLAWGLWTDALGEAAGMAAGLDGAQTRRLTRSGMRAVSPAQGHALLDKALGRPEAQLVPVPIDLEEARKALERAVPPLWRALVRPTRSEPQAKGEWVRELGSLGPEERTAAVLETVRIEVARVLMLDGPSAVAPDQPLKELGLDSLAAIELCKVLGSGVATKLPADLPFDYPTPKALAMYLIERFFGSVSDA